MDFATWLGRHGQSGRTIEALWDLVGVATLNATASDASLGLAAMVFKTGLLSEPGAADIGWAHVPLGDLHDTLARKALGSAGVRTELRTKVTSISRSASGGWEVDAAGERIGADTVVLAVPQSETHALLPGGVIDDPDRLLDIGTAPILNVHVVYDRKVLRRPFFAALGTPVQWVFDRTESSGLKGGGQYLAVSQSACQDEIDAPVAELRARYLPELERLLPAAPAARACATSSSPGSGQRRSPPPPASDGCAPAPVRTRPACTWPRVDRHRMARDHGGCRAQRHHRRRRGAPRTRPRP